MIFCLKITIKVVLEQVNISTSCGKAITSKTEENVCFPCLQKYPAKKLYRISIESYRSQLNIYRTLFVSMEFYRTV